LAEAMRPMTEAVSALGASLAESMRPVLDALASVPTPTLPESVLRHFRRWASMSPRQRARALLAEVLNRTGGLARTYAARVRVALARTLAALGAVLGRIPTDADPPHGPPLALVLLDSTRPVHGPPLPA
jgi:hypothetical protein